MPAPAQRLEPACIHVTQAARVLATPPWNCSSSVEPVSAGRRLALLDRLRHRVEVAGADLALVLDRGEAAFGGGELGFLHFHEGAHLAARVAVGQVEHAVVQRVETGQVMNWNL
jgi:hypothetical protein